jgi:endogenous inhibitor of DNA gyrase (YacG/DUF329 family)
MKNEIKQFILEKNILYPKYNSKYARKNYWNNINPKWSNYIFAEFEKYNNYYVLTFCDFLRLHFFCEKIEHYTSTLDFLTNVKNLQINPNTKKYNLYYKSSLKYINFIPKNFAEIIYCFRNNIIERPKCQECEKNDLEFTLSTVGYRKFCSLKCQMIHNNKPKPFKKSPMSTEKIIEGIKKIPYDSRNTSNSTIANSWINILEFSENLNILDNERIYLFVKQDITLIKCTICGKPKKFKSQKVGYTKTCTRVNCRNSLVYGTHFNKDAENNFYGRGGASFKTGFLYVLYSKKNNFYKIGITQYPDERLRVLKKCISDLAFNKCVFTDKLSETERHFHRKFKEKRIIFDKSFDGYSEFFNLNKNDFEYIEKYLCEN